MVVSIKIWKFLFVRSIYLSAGLPQVCICTASVFFVKKKRHRFWWRSPTGVPDENRFGLKKKLRDTHWTLTQSLLFHPLNTLEQPLRGLYKLGPCKALSTRNEKPIVESNWNGNTAQKGCALRTTTHMYQLLWRSPGFHIEPNSKTEGSEACQWVALLNVFQAMTCTTVVFVWKGCVHISGTPLLQIITQQQATGWQALLSQCDANIASDLQVGDTH